MEATMTASQLADPQYRDTTCACFSTLFFQLALNLTRIVARSLLAQTVRTSPNIWSTFTTPSPLSTSAAG